MRVPTMRFLWLLFGYTSAGEATRATEFECPPQRYRDEAQSPPISSGIFMPVLANHKPGAQVSLAVIAMHGKPREFQQYYEDLLYVVDQQDGCATLAVTPAYPDQECTAAAWNGGSEDVQAPIWSAQGNVREWAYGGFSDPGVSKNGTQLGNISSYAAFDAVVKWVQQDYPSVRAIVVTGYSAGAQMIQRWSVLSPEGADGTTSGALPLRIIVGAASSVLYMTADRPAASCRPDTDTGPTHACSSFGLPEKTCYGTYNDYAIGLVGLEEGSPLQNMSLTSGAIVAGASAYLFDGLAASEGWQAALRRRFATKDVRYLVGADDTVSCTVGACSGNCASMLEGSNRLQRMQNFVGYLRFLFPENEQYLSVVPGLGHSNTWAWRSDAFISWTFGFDPAYEMLASLAQDEGKEVGTHNERFYTLCECKALCDSNPSCNSITYAGDSGECYLKERCVTADATLTTGTRYQTYYRTKCRVAVSFTRQSFGTPRQLAKRRHLRKVHVQPGEDTDIAALMQSLDTDLDEFGEDSRTDLDLDDEL